MDNILKSMVKQNIPYLVVGMVTGFALTYFYGFLIALILNTAIWVTIPYIIRNHVTRSAGASGFAQERIAPFRSSKHLFARFRFVVKNPLYLPGLNSSAIKAQPSSSASTIIT